MTTWGDIKVVGVYFGPQKSDAKRKNPQPQNFPARTEMLRRTGQILNYMVNGSRG